MLYLFRNVLEVTEGFIHQLNNVTNFTEQERLEKFALKIIERVKVGTVSFLIHYIIVHVFCGMHTLCIYIQLHMH